RRRDGEVLVDGLDAGAARVDGALEVHRLAVEQDLALVGDRRARQRLDERRLAGAVVADDGEELAGAPLEVGAVERGDVAVALHQALGLHDGFRLGLHQRPPRRESWSMATARITRIPVIST